jgi:hypothetical protein
LGRASQVRQKREEWILFSYCTEAPLASSGIKNLEDPSRFSVDFPHSRFRGSQDGVSVSTFRCSSKDIRRFSVEVQAIAPSKPPTPGSFTTRVALLSLHRGTTTPLALSPAGSNDAVVIPSGDRPAPAISPVRVLSILWGLVFGSQHRRTCTPPKRRPEVGCRNLFVDSCPEMKTDASTS